MKKSVAVLAGLATALMSVLVAAPQAVADGGAVASVVAPASVTAGRALSVNVTGFSAGESVQFVLQGPQTVSLGTATTDGQGGAAKSFTVPPATLGGSYLLKASDGAGVSASTAVAVASQYHLVSLNANGGKVASSAKSVKAGATLGSLPNPTRKGYTFKGWYTARSGGSKVTSSSKMGSADKVLYAHWAGKKYTVKFVANGGKSLSVKSKSVTMGKSYKKLASVKRTGYSFQGWYTAKSGGVKVTSSVKFTKAAGQKLYAHWKAKTYTVNLKPQSGHVSKTSVKVTYHAKYKVLPTPTRSGYQFNGWYTKKSGGTKVTNSSKVKITKTQTLYAHWTKLKIVGECTGVGCNGKSQCKAGYVPVYAGSGWCDASGCHSVTYLVTCNKTAATGTASAVGCFDAKHGSTVSYLFSQGWTESTALADAKANGYTNCTVVYS